MNASEAGGAVGTKRALLIGIDAYPDLGQRYFLNGCVNDVELMERVLRDNYGFSEENVTTLRDAQATRQNICDAIDALVEQVRDNDIVVIHYSGHGSRITDTHNDEPSGMDSTIVTYDSGRGFKPNRDILDDEIHVWLSQLSQKTSYITLIFDCCHSGGMSRDAFGDTARWVEPDTRPPEELQLDMSNSPLTEQAVAELVNSQGARGLGPSGWVALSESYVTLAGCRDEELSYEYLIPEGKQDFKHGALTYFLSQELVKAEPGSTYRDVFERARTAVNSIYAKQNPQIEGRQDREIFGVRDIEPLRFVGVTKREGDNVTLAAGAAHGMTVGSQWAIYPQGTKQVEGNESSRLGLVEITTVKAVTADAKIIENAQADRIEVGCRAVEEAHSYAAMQLVVDIQAPPGHESQVEGLRQKIEESKLLRLAQNEEAASADYRAYLIPARSSVDEARDPVPQLGVLSNPTWAVVDRGGLLAMPPHGVDDHNAPSTIQDNLVKLARYRNALHLTNLNSSLKNKVDFILKRQKPDGSWEEAMPDPTLGAVVFEEDDRLAFEITNRHNAPVYVSVLDFGLTGTISLVYPLNRSSEKLEKGVSLTLGEKDEDRIDLWMPPTFPHSQGAETLKLFVTSVESDFSWLQQQGMRSLNGTQKEFLTQLEELFDLAYEGTGTRDTRPAQLLPEQEWVTVEKTFMLQRKGL